MTALVTGGKSGLGALAAEVLEDLEYPVIRWGREDCDFDQPETVHQLGRKLARQTPELKCLVHAAGVGRFAPHEQLHPDQLLSMTRVNFLSPMLLTSSLLRRLRDNRGLVLYLNSIEAESHSPGAACYGGTKRGFQHFLKTVYQENRKHGLRVCILSLGMIRTPFYLGQEFEPHPAPDAALNPSDLRAALHTIFAMPSGGAVTEMTVQPNRPRVLRKSVGDSQDKPVDGAN